VTDTKDPASEPGASETGAFARHDFSLRAGQRSPVPDTDYEVGLAVDGVQQQSFDSEGTQVSIVTCRVEVFERGEQVHTELLAENEVAWFRDLEVKVRNSETSGEAHVEVVRAPFRSILPKPTD